MRNVQRWYDEAVEIGGGDLTWEVLSLIGCLNKGEERNGNEIKCQMREAAWI
jgi:hypothetical protein